MQNAVRSACRGKNESANNQGGEKLPGVEEVVRSWSSYFASSAAVEAGGDVVAHGRRFQTVMLLLQAVEKKASVLPFSSVLLLFFCCVSFPLLFGFRWCFFPRPDLFQSQYRFS